MFLPSFNLTKIWLSFNFVYVFAEAKSNFNLAKV